MTKYFTIVIYTLGLILSQTSYSQTNQECLDCHSDRDMTTQKGKKTVSLWVDNSKFIFSAHGKQNCVGCHKGFDPSDIPHKKVIEPVNCQSCHIDVQKKHTFHPWMANAPLKDNCKQCHGTHEVSKPKSPNFSVGGLNSVEKCGSCHVEIKEEFKKSDHYKVLTKTSNANAPDCNYCHKFPITKSWNSDFNTRKESQNQVCSDCHKSNSTNPDVLKKINNDGSRHDLLRKSGKTDAAVCTDCHSNHHIKTKGDFEAKLNYSNTFTSCGSCHIHIAQEYQNSIHGLAQLKGNMEAAACVSCHFEHNPKEKIQIADNIFSDNLIDKEFAYKSKSVFCIKCHTNDSIIQQNKLKTLLTSHDWLPKFKEHFAKVSCFECHSSFTKPYLSHNILLNEKSIKNCNQCHDETLELKSILYNYQKSTSAKAGGMIKGNIAGAENYVGIAKNIVLDYVGTLLICAIIFGLMIHGFVRWYFNKRGKK